MALARLAWGNLSQRVCSSGSSSLVGGHGVIGRGLGGVQRQKWGGDEWLMKRFMATTGDKLAGETSDGKEVAVAEGGSKKSKLFPRSKGKGKRGLWRSNGQEFVPALDEFFPSGLGNALLQGTENINKLFQNLNLSPSNLVGRFKEKEGCYKLRYEVPGVSKEDVKITIEDGVLTIRGEHKEEEGEESDDEHFSAVSYGFYNTSILLPDDAKVDEIKAELKDGVLSIIIPRTEFPKKEAKEVKIH